MNPAVFCGRAFSAADQEQVRAIVVAPDRVLALLGFGAAAWKTAPRDAWIGWTPGQRRERPHWVVNNARFLILSDYPALLGGAG